MNRKLLIAQIVNVIGLTNFLVILMLQNKLVPIVTRFSLIFSSTLVVASVVMMIIFSISFIQKIGNDGQKCSSDFSPIYRYFFSNIATSAVLSLFILGCFIDIEILKVGLLALIVFIFPIIVYNKSVYVMFHGTGVRFYDYSDRFEHINGNQILTVKKVLFGMIYKVSHESIDGTTRTKYFFPRGKFIFFEPSSIKRLRSMK